MSVDIPYQNPFQAPEAPVLESSWEPGELRPVPWEDPESFPTFWKRLGGMFSLAFSSPVELIRRVPYGTGSGAPMRFILTMAAPVLALMVLIFGVVIMFGAFSGAKDLPLWLMPVILVGVLILMPVMYLIQMFLWGAINHASLWMWGGLKDGEPLDQTIRASGYALGFFIIGGLIPLLNYAVMVIVPVVLGMGLARMHRTDTWRGICAAFTPLLICCCLYGVFLVTIIGLGAFNH
jgi:hypothetical protein